MIHPVILCGGSGTRLWPLSRVDKPKPFLPLVGKRSLFEQTLDRCVNEVIFAAPTIVTVEKHLDHVEGQLGEAAGASIIVEPMGKNTAPAIALAALRLPEDAIMLVCPSDHYIKDTAAFVSAAETASALADQGFLVSFGIKATSPETGYGYIKRGEELGVGFAVERFVEKPDLATAQSFLADGSYSWNGGIFAFKAEVFLTELANHCPQMMDALRASVEAGSKDGQRFHPDASSFAQIESDSIDYAVMETTERAAMVPVSMGWSDIGNWDALREAQNGDALGNSIKGQAELVDCTNVMIHSDGPRVSVVGLDDVIIVVDGNDVLVTTAAGTQKVGTLKGAKSQ
ncbi:mannose-1-phosphate guanylyltransferase [Pontixanthobacter sp. CEM42]|uniref:mannose-1-phosphate guanylyltransferase n=1 Tax=Pontixanthobacter sp. CEM42 TaxID=2792077 RepID=UPI001ADF075F